MPSFIETSSVRVYRSMPTGSGWTWTTTKTSFGLPEKVSMSSHSFMLQEVQRFLGLKAPLPENWKPCKTTDTNEVYYFNFSTGR